MNSTSDNEVDVVKIRRLNQHLGAFIASLGGFALGVSLGWNSSAGEILRNHLSASGIEIGLIGGILNVGACIGALSVPLVFRYIGRPLAMLLTMPISIVGWAFICCAGQQATLLIIGRVICGMCGGVFCIVTPTYVAEIADKEIRGRLLTFFQVLINCGIMYAFLIAHVLDERETVWRYSVICALSCVVISLVRLLPESALYYFTKNDEINAEKSLKWYRDNADEIEKETENLKRLILICRTRKVDLTMFRNRKVLRSFAACFGVILSQQFCGIYTMIFYALTLFETSGSGELTGSEQTLIVGTVQILSSLLATVLIDVLGRRVLLTVSCSFMGLSLIFLGWFFRLRQIDPEYDDIYFWMPPTWIILLFGAFNIGVGPISWSMLGDIFPLEIRMIAAASAVSLGWLVSLIATLTFGELIIALGETKIMWFFGGICWIAAVFCAVLVKDTSEKSITEIQEAFDINIAQPSRSIVEDSR